MADPEIESQLFDNPTERALFDDSVAKQIEPDIGIIDKSAETPQVTTAEVVRLAMERRARLGGRPIRWTMGGPHMKT